MDRMKHLKSQIKNLNISFSKCINKINILQAPDYLCAFHRRNKSRANSCLNLRILILRNW
jgi:hypothetical protein